MEASPGYWGLESFDDFAVWATSLALLPKTKPVRQALALLNELSGTVARISVPPLDDLVDIPSSSTPATMPPSSVNDSLFLPSPVGSLASLPVVTPEPPRPRPKTRGGSSNVNSSSNPAAASPGVTPGPPAESIASTSPANSSRIKSKPRGKWNPPPPEYTQEMKPPVRRINPSYLLLLTYS
jgi:hypothetical protein